LRKDYPGMKVYASAAISEALTGFLAKSAESSRKTLAGDKPDPAEREDIATDLATIDTGEELKPEVVLSRNETLAIGGRKLQIHVARDNSEGGRCIVLRAHGGNSAFCATKT
jgi:hypothetical protein